MKQNKRIQLAMARALNAVAALPTNTPSTPTAKPVVSAEVQAAKIAAAQAKRARKAARSVK